LRHSSQLAKVFGDVIEECRNRIGLVFASLGQLFLDGLARLSAAPK
jgi:hypothetical protein